jgi:hypothetical protein
MRVSNRLSLLLAISVLGALAGYGLRALAEGAPRTQPLFYSGALQTADGAPATGAHKVKVALYGGESGGSPVCASSEQAVELTASRGHFRISLTDGQSGDCVQAIHQGAELWAGVQLDGAPSGARTKLGAVPYALESDHAVTASTVASLDSPDKVLAQVNVALGQGGKLSGLPEPGLTGSHLVTAQVDLPSVPVGGTFPEVVVGVSCPAGEKILGGGCATHQPEWLLWINAPEGDGWSCRAKNVSNALKGQEGSFLNGPFVAYAICAR